MISEILVEPVSQLAEIDWEECQEAYVFSEKGQLHFYRDEDDELTCVECEDDELTSPDDKKKEPLHYRDVEYEMVKRSQTKYSRVTVREYLMADTDGQTVVCYTRLLCVK